MTNPIHPGPRIRAGLSHMTLIDALCDVLLGIDPDRAAAIIGPYYDRTPLGAYGNGAHEFWWSDTADQITRDLHRELSRQAPVGMWWGSKTSDSEIGFWIDRRYYATHAR